MRLIRTQTTKENTANDEIKEEDEIERLQIVP
jgi:hypothetical protein